MLRTPVVLGISMAHRKSRRFLVALTYTAMMTFAVAILMVLSRRDKFESWFMSSIAFLGGCSLVFTLLVRQTGPLDMQRGEVMTLGLVPRRHNQDQLDEREVAIRNAACFQAYRVLALYSITIFAAAGFAFELRTPAAIKVLEVLTVPLLGLVPTLPQAALLWSEPYVPKEAKV